VRYALKYLEQTFKMFDCLMFNFILFLLFLGLFICILWINKVIFIFCINKFVYWGLISSKDIPIGKNIFLDAVLGLFFGWFLLKIFIVISMRWVIFLIKNKNDSKEE
jgi:hypothetical protein